MICSWYQIRLKINFFLQYKKPCQTLTFEIDRQHQLFCSQRCYSMRVFYFSLVFILTLKASFLSPYSAFAMDREENGDHSSRVTRNLPPPPLLPGGVPDLSPHPATPPAQSMPAGSVPATPLTIDAQLPQGNAQLPSSSPNVSAPYRLSAPPPLFVLSSGVPISLAAPTLSLNLPQANSHSPHSNYSLSPMPQPIGSPQLPDEGGSNRSNRAPSSLARGNPFQHSLAGGDSLCTSAWIACEFGSTPALSKCA